MKKFIPYEKLSKKEKRRIDAAKRNTCGAFDPVTRKPQNSKAYNRNKARNWKREIHETNSGAYYSSVSLYMFQKPPRKAALKDNASGHFARLAASISRGSSSAPPGLCLLQLRFLWL